MAFISCYFYIFFIVLYIQLLSAWPWQSQSILPTDLVGAQTGIWKSQLHLINGVYNPSKLNLPQDNDNVVLWLTTNLSSSISITSATTASFDTSPSAASWNILTTTNSLGAFSCFSKCSAQIDNYLYVISPERIDNNMPTGYLIVYDLETQQLIPPPIGLLKTPYLLNGGACVVHNDSHLFALGGYNTRCPNKFDNRCQDAMNVIIHNTYFHNWTIGAALPNDAKVDAAACAMDNKQRKIYLFGGYNKYSNSMSDKVFKYMIHSDEFDLNFDGITMIRKRSEFNAVVDKKQNFAYLIGGAIDDSMNTGQLIEVFDMNKDGFIATRSNGLSHSIRWYGSELYAFNENIDLLMIIGGHTGQYDNTGDLKQSMVDYVQYLMIDENAQSEFTQFPTIEPTVEPTEFPTIIPSKNPTFGPTKYPSVSPTTSNPTYSPFTSSPSSAITIPYVVDIDMDIDCKSDFIQPKIYPPTLDQIAHDLLNSKINEEEMNPNLWVKSIVSLSDDTNSECALIIKSKYSTNVYNNAQIMNEYAKTTLSEDIIAAIQSTFNLNIHPNDLQIIHNLITFPISNPTIFPSQDPTFYPSETPTNSIDSTVTLVDFRDEEDQENNNQETHSFASWLYGENNLNWIIMLVLCCLIFPCCFLIIFYLVRLQIKTSIKHEKKRFHTMSASQTVASPDQYHHTTYRPQRRKTTESSDDDDVVPVNHPLDHISPIQNTLHKNGGGAHGHGHGSGHYHHVSRPSLDGYHRPRVDLTIPMTGPLPAVFNPNNMGNMTVTSYRDDYDLDMKQDDYTRNTDDFDQNGFPLDRQHTTTTDHGTDYDVEMDGSGSTTTTMSGIQRRNTYTGTSVNQQHVYVEPEHNEYKNSGKVQAEIDAIDGNMEKVQSKVHDHKLSPKEEDFLVVAGMGITPSLVPLTSGSSKDNLTISIQRRKKMDAAFQMMQVDEFDDYKIAAKSDKDVEDSSVTQTSTGMDEYQIANASNLFSPPLGNKLGDRKRGNKMFKQTHKTHLEKKYQQVELPEIGLNNNDESSLRVEPTQNMPSDLC